MIHAHEALTRLREGNKRFKSGASEFVPNLSPSERNQLLEGQEPFAVVLGCSDSRVPVELIFDQGFGDLFVIRVAGNVVASSQIGSIEFAAEKFNVRLVIVLGHTQCGAIQATLDELKQPSENQSRNLRSIVGRIRPSVEGLLETDIAKDPEQLVRQAVRSNVRMSTASLRHGSEILEQLIDHEGLVVVGAEYSLHTGEVEFFDGVPLNDNQMKNLMRLDQQSGFLNILKTKFSKMSQAIRSWLNF